MDVDTPTSPDAAGRAHESGQVPPVADSPRRVPSPAESPHDKDRQLADSVSTAGTVARISAHPHPPDPHRLRLALRQRIARLYATTDDTLQVGPMSIPFTRVADPNIVLNQAAEAEGRRDRDTGTSHVGDELHLPYWAQLWESSLGVGVFLAQHWAQMHPTDHPSAVSRLAKSLIPQSRRARVLDLGCGMGLTGAVAARLGAEVTFADLEPAALLFARLNSFPHRDRCHYRQLNWRTDTLTDRFDLILGADVLYERRQWEPLDAFFRHHLAPNGAVILGEPGRITGDDYPAWITPRGWTLERFAQPRPDGKPIRVFQLTSPAQTVPPALVVPHKVPRTDAFSPKGA